MKQLITLALFTLALVSCQKELIFEPDLKPIPCTPGLLFNEGFEAGWNNWETTNGLVSTNQYPLVGLKSGYDWIFAYRTLTIKSVPQYLAGNVYGTITYKITDAPDFCSFGMALIGANHDYNIIAGQGIEGLHTDSDTVKNIIPGEYQLVIEFKSSSSRTSYIQLDSIQLYSVCPKNPQ
jgi:hypothetical protein